MDRKALTLVFNGLFVVATVQAGVVPGRWEKMLAEMPGTEIIITLSAGDEIQGNYRELRKDELIITVNGAQRALPKAAIARIKTAERRAGPLSNGALIGAAIGGSFAAIATVATGAGDEPQAWIAIPLWAAIGAGVGVGIDALVQSRITLYEAPLVK